MARISSLIVRFPGLRSLVALAATTVLLLLVMSFNSTPPRALARWPPEAKQAAGGLIFATYYLALAACLFGFTRRAIAQRRQWMRLALLVGVGVLTATAASHAFSALGQLVEMPIGGVFAILRVWGWRGALPTILAATPIAVSEIIGKTEMSLVWRRLFKTGQGPSGGWMSPMELEQYTRPLPERLR